MRSVQMNNLPSTLIRCFEREEYALQFIAGRIRFGLLEIYHQIEGARHDDQEGKVTFQWNIKAPNYTFDEDDKLVYSGESDTNIFYDGESINPRNVYGTS